MKNESLDNQVLFGGYTGGKQAQSVFHYNPKQQAAIGILSCINPSFIVCRGDYVYIASQVEEGEIITLHSKDWKIISRLSTLGSDPCHLSLNKQSTFLTATNYSSGSVSVFMLEDYKPTKIRCFITHEGSSVNKQRQSSPHPHCSVFSPDSSILFVTDLGTDIVYYYSITPEQIKAEKQKSIKMQGSGPRTICLGKEQDKKLFVSCQLDNTIRVLSYENNALEVVVAYRISSNPQNYPSQVFYWRGEVFIANRGDDMILIFNDDGTKLTQKLGFKVGNWPRHITITDQGVMYVACQKQNKIYRYLLKEDKILKIGELAINQPSVTAVLL